MIGSRSVLLSADDFQYEIPVEKSLCQSLSVDSGCDQFRHKVEAQALPVERYTDTVLERDVADAGQPKYMSRRNI